MHYPNTSTIARRNTGACKTTEYIKLPKNYREDSVLEFGAQRNKRRSTTLMFMLCPEPHETFTPKTIYIQAGVKRNEWLKENMYFNDEDFVLEVCSIISHESVHIVLFKVAGREACDKLDPTFSGSFMNTIHDNHGLLGLDTEFKPRKNKLKGWGKKGR